MSHWPSEPSRVRRRGERSRGCAAATLAVVALAIGCGAASAPGSDEVEARKPMVDHQIEERGIKDERVLAAMRSVPRHEFVPAAVRDRAYDDSPLSIGEGQTISQPYIVAAMSEFARIAPDARVLEIGTGSGYQAAVLCELAAEVYSIEIVEPLARRARETLERLGYRNVHLRVGDGHAGWPEQAPFDAILVTAAPVTVPPALLEQLAVGGRLVIPVGRFFQELEVHTRTETGFEVERKFPVIFVPMTGREPPPTP